MILPRRERICTEIEHTKVIVENGIITYGGNQSRFGDEVRKTACGMIAACDMLLRFRDKGCTPLPFDEYRNFVSNMTENHFYKHSRNSLGVPVYKILNALNKGQAERRFRFISRVFLSAESLTAIITKSLESNMPVIVRIGANRKKLPYKIAFPVSGNTEREERMTWHYITATGIEKNNLIFYSWGGKGTMKISDLCRFFGFTGGIITAE